MKKLPILITAAAVLIGGSFVYLLTTDKAKEAKDQMLNAGQTPVNTAVSTKDRDGRYIDYSENAIASSAGTKLLFFHAPWCQQCRDLETDIKKDGVPNGTTIIKVDYDTNQALRRKYGVTLQTTFVKIDDNGNEIEKFVAYDDPTLDAVIDKLL